MRPDAGKPSCGGEDNVMQIDALKIEILEDGTIKTTSDAVSAANHDNAEQFLRAMARLAGGETTREGRKDRKHGHAHHHHDGTEQAETLETKQ